MANSYFQFKEFRIEQGKSAMKVCTDACIQGAWTPVHSGVRRVLDVGAGTGLLSLMLAQRTPAAVIDAVELDSSAAQQASENVAASPWSSRVRVIRGDARSFPAVAPYDLIICNPPFFRHALLGPTDSRNIARHTLQLSYNDLFDILHLHLAATGYASILLPVDEHFHWKALVESKGWHIRHELHVFPKGGTPANRIISLCSPVSTTNVVSENLIIRNPEGRYTPEFTHLLQPFYLML